MRVVGADNVNDYYDPALKRARLKELEPYSNFSFLEGDLADEGFTQHLFAEVKPDVVVHLAAQAGVRYSIENPRAYIESNVIGFFNVLEQVRHHPVEHFLYASSSSVYGNREETPFSVEDRVDKPVSLYAATKKSTSCCLTYPSLTFPQPDFVSLRSTGRSGGRTWRITSSQKRFWKTKRSMFTTAAICCVTSPISTT
jgi:nucleoside-diphosphate-sugar epimerase